MKRIIIILVAVLSLLCLSSCQKQGTFSVSPTSMTLKVGECEYFKINTGDVDYTQGELGTKVAEGSEYARVDGSLVTALAPGKATIVAYFIPKESSQASHTATLTVTVTE